MEDWFAARERFEDVSILDTPTYFYGLEVGQEIFYVELEAGKTLVITLSTIGEIDDQGNRTVLFGLNGHARQVTVRDRSRNSSLRPSAAKRRSATPPTSAHRCRGWS